MPHCKPAETPDVQACLTCTMQPPPHRHLSPLCIDAAQPCIALLIYLSSLHPGTSSLAVIGSLYTGKSMHILINPKM